MTGPSGRATRQYYKRSTEGFYRLEHFDLEDMFGRRPVPVLELATRMVGGGYSGGGGNRTYHGTLILSIMNRGRGSAKSPYLAFTVDEPYRIQQYGLDGNGNVGLPRLRTADPNRHVHTSADIVVHPGMSHDVNGVELAGYVEHPQQIRMPAPLRLLYELACENARPRQGELIVAPEDIAAAVFPADVHWRAQ